MLSTLLILGFLLGLCGTVIETVSYSVEHKKLTYRGDKYFWGFPSKPIYAIGGLLLYFTIRATSTLPWYVSVLISTLILITWEYTGGVFCVRVLGLRLWNYSNRKINIQGHISWWSTKWWLVFSTLFYFFIYGYFDAFKNYLNRSIKISVSQDLLIFIAVISFVTIITFLKSARDRT